MNLGFHIVVVGNRPAQEVLERMDQAAQDLGLFGRESGKYGFQQRVYRRRDQDPELCFWLKFGAGQYDAAMTPLEERAIRIYTLEFLVGFWSGLCLNLDAVLGRTYAEGLYGTISPNETVGSLEFVDWYQYLSPRIVERFGASRLREGPFYRVDEYSNGAYGILLSKSPFESIPRSKAAEYLGIVLPKLYGKNPKTGEPMEISWG